MCNFTSFMRKWSVTGSLDAMNICKRFRQGRRWRLIRRYRECKLANVLPGPLFCVGVGVGVVAAGLPFPEFMVREPSILRFLHRIFHRERFFLSLLHLFVLFPSLALCFVFVSCLSGSQVGVHIFPEALHCRSVWMANIWSLVCNIRTLLDQEVYPYGSIPRSCSNYLLVCPSFFL